MYDINELKKGIKIEINDIPFSIIESQFVKPGKGQAFTRTKLKNLLNSNVIEKTYKSGEKLKPANIMDKAMSFLYEDGGKYIFMNNSTYEQVEITKEQLDDSWKWLTENMEVTVLFWNDNPISVTLPNFSILQITYCEPGIKGDTATNATKSATLSTGAIINVPLFINNEEYIKIDTRTECYVERGKK